MKNIPLYGIGLLMACTAACTDADMNKTSQPVAQRPISLFATADVFTSLPSTRTQIGDMADDGALTVEWSVGDRIGVFGQSAVNEPFTSSNIEPASSTTFTGTMTGSDLPVYAYYPYQEGVTDKTAIPVEIPEVQMYRDVSSVAQYDFKATDEITDAGSGYSLKLRQMAALVRFEIDLTGEQDLADDELLLDMTIHPSGESMDGAAPMTGRFTYNLTNLDAGLQPGEYTMDGITIQFAIPPTAREKAIAYAVVAPGKHKGNEWTCVFTTDRQQGTFTTTALCDFEAGMYYVVPLTATTLENNDAVIEDIPEELQEETANCYIVTEPGEHSFKATVIGNGQKGIIPGVGFHTENPYINPKSAKVLWSDRKDFVTDVRLENGRVVYTIPDAIASSVDGSIYGNAVIAVYSEPDCQGELLWSWHIWGTQGMPQDVEYTNQAGAKFMVMDRDLGRSSAKSSYNDYNVLRYQWGRKDPFPGKDTQVRSFYIDGTTKEAMSNLKGYNYNLETDATIADAVRNPMHLIHSSQTSQYNWLTRVNVYLWGDGDRELPETLGDASTAGAGWKQQKTIYDPSPVGYRVASIFTFSGFTDMPTGTTKDVTEPNEGNSIVAARLDYINYVKVSGSDWHFKANADDTEGVYYPALKSLEGTNGKEKNNAGSGGYWWTSESYVGDDAHAYACYLNTDAYKGGSVVAGSTSGNVINTYGRTGTYARLLRDAYAVRCVRE